MTAGGPIINIIDNNFKNNFKCILTAGLLTSMRKVAKIFKNNFKNILTTGLLTSMQKVDKIIVYVFISLVVSCNRMNSSGRQENSRYALVSPSVPKPAGAPGVYILLIFVNIFTNSCVRTKDSRDASLGPPLTVVPAGRVRTKD